MLDFSNKIKELKLKNDDLVNFRVSFNKSVLFLEGELIENGVSEGYYTAGSIAHFFVPTKKGYISSEWKKNKLFKMGKVEVTDDMMKLLEPFLQSKSPKTFTRDNGIPTSNVVAKFINNHSGDPYCNA